MPSVTFTRTLSRASVWQADSLPLVNAMSIEIVVTSRVPA